MSNNEAARSKRRRSQHAPPTAEDIAQSNATLQFITGRGTMWTHTNTSARAMGSSERNTQRRPAPARSSIDMRGAPAISTSMSTHMLLSASSASPTLATTTPSLASMPLSQLPSQPQAPLTRQQFIRAVQPATQTIPHPAMLPYPEQIDLTQPQHTSHARQGLQSSSFGGRMAADASVRSLTRPSLPSPAPSDGAVKSPHQHTSNDTMLHRPPGVITPDSANVQSHAPHSQPPYPPPPPPPPHPGHGNPRLSTRVGSLENQIFQQPHPSAAAIYAQAMSGVVGPSDLNGLTVPPATDVLRSQHPTFPANAPPFRIHINVSMARIEEMQICFPAANASNSLDSGRLLLLREAVKAGDGFCLVLHQLFCLAYLNPASLKHPFDIIDVNRLARLETLLGSNRDADPALLAFCATFPEPLAHVYAGFVPQMHDSDDGMFRAVADFMFKFPQSWDYFRSLCHHMSAPLLVQDMVDFLGIRSPVLQTTAFRAIARAIPGLTDLKGLTCLEHLHRRDQTDYIRHGYRRTPSERGAVYDQLSHLVASLAQWERGPDNSPFQVPHSVTSALSQRPRSMVKLPPRQPHLPSPQQNQRPQSNLPMPQNPQTLPTQPPTHRPSSTRQTASSHAMPPNGISPPPRAHLSNTPQSQPSRSMRLFPHPQDPPRPQPTQPNPLRSALHQAHLRSPTLTVLAGPREAKHMYRHVIGYGLPPTRLNMSYPSQSVSFAISNEAMAALPSATQSESEASDPPTFAVTEGTRTYRLRCSVSPPTGFPTEASWIVADNYWPEEMHLEFNGHMLEKRRKLHHGKHLPINLTHLMQEGRNELKVFLNRLDEEVRKPAYTVAVEIIKVVSQDTIRNRLSYVSAEQSLSDIKKSLTNGADRIDDDDVAVTSSSLTIKLFDPYSSCKIFDLPVRGAACLHRDCFDLDTFLAMCKRPPGSNQPTVVDCWRCPLCRGDVRPHTLVVDEFLVAVRAELASRAQLDTRAIVIEADGSWKPKIEEHTGVRSPSLERQQDTPASASDDLPPQQTKAVEIIELD